MAGAETRTTSALYKRAEQLKRWEESETNREPAAPRPRPRRVRFSSGCVFLAACAAAERDEVLRLLERGADVDTANVDGLTALHQACIDDNLEMVEFLVERGADVNRGDNEGWTPLHATASCGFVSIAKYLVERGADVAAVNCDGELALDIAESDRMAELLRAEVARRGVDCAAARAAEERRMLRDAGEWLAGGASSRVDAPTARGGATPLHVAAAKGYAKVVKVLLQCGADVNKQDNDGWTPLHAAAHWGQMEAMELLANNNADMDAQNFVGQTPFDVCDNDMLPHLEMLKKRQVKEEATRTPTKKRQEQDRPALEPEMPPKVKRVEVKIEGGNEEDEELKTKESEVGMEVSSSSSSSESDSDESASSSSESDDSESEKKNKVNTMNNDAPPVHIVEVKEPPEPVKPPPSLPPKQPPPDNVNVDDSAVTWRRPNQRPNSFREKDGENEVTVRRIHSFQNDPEFYARYQELRARIQANSFPCYYHPPNKDKFQLIIPPLLNISNRRQLSKSNKLENEDAKVASVTATTATTTTTLSTTTSSPTATTTASVANTTVAPSPPAVSPTKPTVSPLPNVPTPIRRSFVPPVRDEESETQRKAHAKRVRETRRSTQGVTLEEIKSAEQLVKMKNQSTTTTNNNNNNNNNSLESSGGANGDAPSVSAAATITTATPTVVTKEPEDAPTTTSVTAATAQHERRPSWRLRVDNGSKFKLEDVNKPEEPPSTPSYVRRTGLQTNPLQRPSSAPIETAETTTVTIPLRRPKSTEEKIALEQDKENDARNAQATLATQAAIQRRRRPKRRSTGVVTLENMEDGESEKDPSGGGGGGGGGDYEDSTKLNHQDSGNDSRSGRSSRVSSSSDLILRGENGEIDYKRLYEQSLTEIDRLKDKLRKSDEELRDTKQTLEKLQTVTSKNSLSELEKREKRAMERKLSEMEEELKQLQKLKAENERLRAENRALTRVVNKLSIATEK